MSYSDLSIQDEGVLQLLLNAGVAWDLANGHYWVLVKDTYTPSDAHVLYSDISGDLCTSVNYAAQNVLAKTLVESAGVIILDCTDPDFTDSGTDDMLATYLCLLEGDYSAPDAGDVFIGRVNLNVENSTDLTFDSAFLLETTGILTITLPV